MQAYRVKHWADVHETNESRKYQRLSWAAMPLKHDGLGFRHTVRQSDRNDLLAGWYMLLQVAGKGPKVARGWLVRDGKPLTALDLSLMTGVSEPTFKRCFEFFVQPPADWLELAEFPGTPAQSPASPGNSPGTPAQSPASPGNSPGTPAQSPASRPVDNSTVQNSTRCTENKKGEGTSGAAVAASRTQFAALQKQIFELEARKSELTGTERAELRKKRAALSDLQSRQAQGDFSTTPKN